MRLWLGLIAVFAIATQATLPARAPARPTRDSDGGIYEAVLKALLGDLPPVIVVQAEPLSLPVPSTDDWRWFGVGVEALRAKVENNLPAPAEPFAVDTFPPGTQLVAGEAIQGLFRGGSLMERWTAFRARYKARTLQRFSRPAKSNDDLDALVYYSHVCGSQCGETGYAWLHRASSGAAWVVLKRLPKVVS
jgi:hypothetical protein